MDNCTECEYFKIEHGEDLCSRAKCMKTSKHGKTIAWRMTKCFIPDPTHPKGMRPCEPASEYLEKRVKSRKIPSWCKNINKSDEFDCDDHIRLLHLETRSMVYDYYYNMILDKIEDTNRVEVPMKNLLFISRMLKCSKDPKLVTSVTRNGRRICSFKASLRDNRTIQIYGVGKTKDDAIKSCKSWVEKINGFENEIISSNKNMNMKTFKSQRGFSGYEFNDSHNESCSIQESSSDEPHIWLGLNEIKPQLLLSDVDNAQTGWIDYPLPNEVKIFGRMHLSQEQVKELIPYLQYFVDNGTLPPNEN